MPDPATPDQPFLDSSLDGHLKNLAIEAQRCPAQSRARQRALAKLLSALQKSGKLVRPYRGQFQGLYQDIYAEALQRLFTHVCDRIEDYNPDRAEVLQWVNFLLSRRFFIEASRETMPTVYKGMNPKTVKHMTLDDLDRTPPAEVNSQLVPSLSQELEQVIQEDPDGLFQQAYISDHPQASFQTLVLRRLAGFSWQEISAELGISIPTLSSFYQRCLTRFADKLREYIY